MLGLLPCVTLEGFGHLGITLAVGLTAHRKVHAHLGAFAHEMVFETLHDFGIRTFCHTQNMLVYERKTAVLFLDFNEFACRNTAHGAFLGSCGTLMDITAYRTSEFLVHNFPFYLLRFNSVCFQGTLHTGPCN